MMTFAASIVEMHVGKGLDERPFIQVWRIDAEFAGWLDLGHVERGHWVQYDEYE